MQAESLIARLADGFPLTRPDFATILRDFAGAEAPAQSALAAFAAERAVAVRKRIYGTDVYVRGLIEISSYCRNDCLYCGIRRSNAAAQRYRLSPEEILACADEGHALGFRTFVLQGGEDPFFTDAVLEPLIRELKRRHPDSAVTLSLGERGEESFSRLFAAGADRYLLRHETANPTHYAKLHPPEMSWQRRMDSLAALRRIGYQVGSGFMVGSPFQTLDDLAAELEFVQSFRPDMCGIGPFIPHRDTPFGTWERETWERGHPARGHGAAPLAARSSSVPGAKAPGKLPLTCFLLSLIRLIHPTVLLPATTALGTIDPQGREKGILAGANVVMPNLSPVAVRKKYALYDNKICTGEESAQCRGCLMRRMDSIGYRIVTARGDRMQAP